LIHTTLPTPRRRRVVIRASGMRLRSRARRRPIRIVNRPYTRDGGPVGVYPPGPESRPGRRDDRRVQRLRAWKKSRLCVPPVEKGDGHQREEG
jgi:hypothetical protein